MKKVTMAIYDFPGEIQTRLKDQYDLLSSINPEIIINTMHYCFANNEPIYDYFIPYYAKACKMAQEKYGKKFIVKNDEGYVIFQ